MEKFEKVEKLSARANVSFEEAKEALENCDWDLLDAMVHLEQQGKVKAPGRSTYSTSYEEQEDFVSVKEQVSSQQKETGLLDALRNLVRGFIEWCRGNYFCAKRNGEIKLKVPMLAFIILTLIFWQIELPVMAVLLFCGFRYSFFGKDELKGANRFMDKVGDLAEMVKDNLTGENEKAEKAEKTEEFFTEAEKETI